MMRSWFVAIVLFGASIAGAYAQASVVERAIKAPAGQIVRIGVFTTIRPDCTSGPLPAIRLVAPAAHGSVSVRRATLKATNVQQCLAIEVPALIALYRAAPNFSGTDQFQLEITFAGGRKELQHFQIAVTSATAGGQGI